MLRLPRQDDVDVILLALLDVMGSTAGEAASVRQAFCEAQTLLDFQNVKDKTDGKEKADDVPGVAEQAGAQRHDKRSPGTKAHGNHRQLPEVVAQNEEFRGHDDEDHQGHKT